MKLVLLSGGSGKRLWPMSNDSRSKQFLKVLTDDHGRAVSMLQRVWAQLEKTSLAEHAYICASKAQIEMIVSQVGNAPVIVEPERRDTFAAIAVATMHLIDIDGVSPDEIVVVLPVDPYVDDAYFSAVISLERDLQASGADLALLGVRPTEPTSKFGYICVSDAQTDVSGRQNGYAKVTCFVEKPPRGQAEEMIAQGALWNCGVFCFRLGYLREMLRAYAFGSSHAELVDHFAELPKRSFDYEVVEKAESVIVKAYEGTWKDLGTWNALSEEMTDEFIGQGIAVQCENTHVVNELGIPLVAMGMNGVVVVATPDGILVADKEHSSAIKGVVESFSGRPMYEERRWGSYRVLDYMKMADGIEAITKMIELIPGCNISYHKHMQRTEIWTIIQGAGELVLDTRIIRVAPGDVVRVFPEQWHAIRALDKLQFIEIQRGPELVEEDIARRFMDWNDIVEYCAALTI